MVVLVPHCEPLLCERPSDAAAETLEPWWHPSLPSCATPEMLRPWLLFIDVGGVPPLGPSGIDVTVVPSGTVVVDDSSMVSVEAG